MGSNGSRDIAKAKHEGEDASSSRTQRSVFSNSFSSHDLRSLEFEEAAEKEDIYVSCPLRGPEDCPRSLDSEGASSKASTSDSDERATTTHWRGFFSILKKGPQMRFQTFPPLKGVSKFTRRKSKRIREDMVPPLNPPPTNSSLDAELSCFKSSWKNFTLSDLQVATNNFSQESLIGEGGYAEVYKGELEHGELVAVKRLTRGSQEEMTADFLSELGIIVHVDHPNIAKLIGYGVEGGMHLVLDLSPHGALSSILYGPREKLDWGIRYKIILGTAEGLLYLHEGCQRRIIHKDIKASNILLSEDFEPQISDFGLAKWLPDQWTHHTVSKIEGTFGYLPPEFFMHGIVDEKTDVYAFGVLLLELITGRQALDCSQKSLVMWAKPLLSKTSFKELLDPCLDDAYDVEQMSRVVLTASMCIHQSSVNRPQMSQVVQILKGDEGSLEVVKQRQKSKLRRTYSEELFDAEEYNSTKYLNDLDRHMETILGLSNDL
ncbi:Mitogen-activated protein kinase kinase kinase [Parasponia andersonii]|uniref:non-specific serine/threonine protein kinase n=1 Tax=Parasponia andersonii TaxID=3476 RepID=A0A2P5E3Y5_PARAD|nr:Mitogen-activated protein kinase kinase kinase [Parasponia andersonii]